MRFITYRKYFLIGMNLYNDPKKAEEYATLVTSVRCKSTQLSFESFKEVRHLHKYHNVSVEELAFEYNVHIQEIIDALNRTGKYKHYY